MFKYAKACLVIGYHVNPSWRLAYLLSFVVTIRTVVLSSATTKAKKDRDKCRATTRIVLVEKKAR